MSAPTLSTLRALVLALAGCSNLPDICEGAGSRASPIIAGTPTDATLKLTEAQRRAIGVVAPAGSGEAERALRACSATLVEPGWVLTAGHCARASDATLSFWPGPAAESGAAIDALRLVRHPESDLLLLDLGEPGALTAELTPIRLAERTLRVGEEAELAGYGERADGGRGELRFAAERVVAVDSSFVVVDGQGRTGACGGDSGGPLLARERDGSVRVFGALSAGSEDCRGIDLYSVVRGDDAFFPFAATDCDAP